MIKKVIIAGALMIVCLLVIGLFSWNLRGPQREMERIALSMVGQPEAELLKALGQPRHVVTAATLDGRPVDYPWQGMNFVPIPTLTVHNKVLLYSKLDMAIYVYVNEQDVVEYVVTAGT
jgi:hypothetical protein